MSLVDLAFDGTLKPRDLTGREKEIDAVDKATLYTPLGAAVFSRHKEVIKLLLDYGANPNGVPQSYPPLWIAAARTKGHIGSIVGMLLARKPDVNIASDLTNKSTPLHALVKRYRSEDDVYVIEALVDAGANPNAKNKRGESAMSVATARNDKKLLAILSPNGRKRSHLRNLGMLVSLILFVFAWVNKRPALMVAAGISATAIRGYGPIKKRFKISGLDKAEIPPHILEKVEKDKSARNFKEEMNRYIKKAHLDQFFRKGKEGFLDEVIKKAVDLQSDPKSSAHPSDLIRLALFQPVLYCDDSGSMKRDNRIQLQADLSERITSLTTRLVPDGTGIELRLINGQTSDLMSKPSPEKVSEILKNRVVYAGPTEIGTNCRAKILEEVVYQPIRKKMFHRPVLVSILTDGCPLGPPGSNETRDTLKDVILKCGVFLEKHGYRKDVVRFQISQIGQDAAAKEFIKSLATDDQLKGVLYCTTRKKHTYSVHPSLSTCIWYLGY
ncbi:hypothetical protein A9Z42_0025650 [Trichoderma parareesei]|uniref:Uncharacterized protein n=1 Tax=Trichoderma parareesei TaxID=858221 RepID=A0A2H2ZQ33_TRIPA|nr:hypothetical protein A9Z42_0025650 [Trichoderma parareesei]